jgi:hypothetical protein
MTDNVETIPNDKNERKIKFASLENFFKYSGD